MGARALAKSIGDNNKLLSLNLSNNSFTNDTIEILTNSLTRNITLKDLNLSGNEIFCRYDTRIKADPSILVVGKEALVYKMFIAAATNQSLKIFHVKKKK
jgi:Ran GTPase-activating protein (RanGAP) involved in mRNA processing and transport